MKILWEYTAELIDVQPANEQAALTWSEWRREYIGRQGWLQLRMSEKKRPGGLFLYFYGGDGSDKEWTLRTSCGDPERNGRALFFETKNSRYEFAILYDPEEEPKEKKYKPLVLDFGIPEVLQDTINLLLNDLNEHNARFADCYSEEIRSILNCCSIDEELIEEQIDVLRWYYCRGGIYAANEEE